MGRIDVVGLGPGALDELTLGTVKLLKRGNVYLRTEVHPCVDELKELGIRFESFDPYYEKGASFEEVYDEIAQFLIEASRTRDIVYAVPGNPLFAEDSVQRLVRLAEKNGIELTLHPAVSFVDLAAQALCLDPNDGLQLTDAFKLTGDPIEVPAIDPSENVLIAQVFSSYIAGELALSLSRYYPDETEVVLLSHLGLPDEKIKRIALYTLPREEVDHLTTLFIPAQKENLRSLSQFTRILRRLLAPDGCPWDREQTHETLRTCLIEEAYEAVDAIDEKDAENLKEELGDILLQIVFHALLSESEGDFTMEEIIERVGRKMIERHPHVFGDKEASNSEEVLVSWEEIKAKEKKSKGALSEMKKIPRSYTALMKAQKIQDKARKEGFDWKDPYPAYEKVLEEAKEALAELQREPQDPEKLEEELGDLLFACVNFVRLCGVYAEEALGRANKKFVSRYASMQALCTSDGKVFKDLSLEEQDSYWVLAKERKKECR